MDAQTAVELILAAGAAFLLARDLRRAWRDPLRRPARLLVAALMAALLIGVVGGRSHPSSWWLVVPGVVLGWEVIRGWRLVPRSHLWEAGLGAFAIALALAAFGLLVAAGALGALAIGLLWLSHRREPPPWRRGDIAHYERRAAERAER